MPTQERTQVERDLERLGARSMELSRERARWRTEAVAAARHAVAAGIDIQRIAQLLGITRATVYAWLRE